MDTAAAGMQVLAGTVSIDLGMAVWPVNPETTGHAIDSMADFARELIDQSVENPRSLSSRIRPVPVAPRELTPPLAGVTGPAATKLYVNATEARVIRRTSGPSRLPLLANCGYDDATYSEALAGGATTAQAIASAEDRVISLDVNVISTGTSVQPPYPV